MDAYGYTLVDTGFVRAECTACFLIEQDGKRLLFDTGVGPSVPNVIRALEGDLESVDHIVLSHVHLDHAGGAGELMRLCPNAQLWVHPRGLRHMVDPTLLERSAREVYGDAVFERLYGRLLPVPGERAAAADWEEPLIWQGREFRLMDAPGHAKHHLVLWEAAAATLLAGDAFGLGYPTPLPTLLPTTSPVQFDPDAMVSTYHRLAGLQPNRIGIAHFGWVTDAPKRAAELEALVHRHVEIARACEGDPNGILPQLRELVPAEARDTYQFDFELNAQGLAHWFSLAHAAGPQS